jgi:PAS domain S-box-containing protein
LILSITQWIREIFFWRKAIKNTPKYDISVIDDVNQQLSDAVLSTTDISQRIIKKLESKVDDLKHKVTEREELLSQVFSTIDDVLLLKDGNGRWKVLNDYGKKFLGIVDREYKEKTDIEICTISPKYAEVCDMCVKSDEEAWELGVPLQVEEHSFNASGEEIIFDITKTPIFNEDGSRKHLLVHGKNVTEELNNTKHIRMLLTALNSASDSIMVTDHNHKIIYANDAFCAMHGYELIEIIDNNSNMIASGFTSDATYKDMFASILKAKIWSGEMVNQKKDGTLIKSLVTITPVLNGKPEPIYYIGLSRSLERRSSPRTDKTI